MIQNYLRVSSNFSKKNGGCLSETSLRGIMWDRKREARLMKFRRTEISFYNTGEKFFWMHLSSTSRALEQCNEFFICFVSYSSRNSVEKSDYLLISRNIGV